MFRFIQYFARFHAFQERWASMSVLGRGVLLILALPGIAAIALSIVALVVSILALLLLTVPVYRAIRWLSGDEVTASQRRSATCASVRTVAIETVSDDDIGVVRSAGPRRHVDVKIIE